MRKNESGYTLVEILVVILIISIVISIAGFSVNLVMSRNVDATITELVSEIRITKTMQIEKSSVSYKLQFFQTSDDIILRKTAINEGDINPVILSEVKVPKNFELFKVIAGSEIKVSDLIQQNRTDEISFCFDSATGKVSSGGYGKYILKYKDKEANMNIIKQNGKVILNE